jgi:hypothetical protein
MEEIASRFLISTSRVQQIIYANRHWIKIDKEYEKFKRLTHLKRMLKNHPDAIGRRC